MNKVDIIKSHKPDILIQKFNKIKTIESAIDSNQKSLAFYKKEYNKEYVINYIMLWIISLNEFFNSKVMSAMQIKETANYIYDDYYYLNLADIYLIFTKIKKGEFGQIFGSLDGLKILLYFKSYASDRANICENNSIREHENKKYEQNKSSEDNRTRRYFSIKNILDRIKR